MDFGISLNPVDLISGYLGYKGTEDTNTANRDIASARNLMEVEEAKKARDFSAEQSEIGRQFTSKEASDLRSWQEKMSSTAVSRRMADMKSAGLNPILAGKYDASTPAGAMGTHAQPATAKANAHGYTAQNKIQGLLDNLGTALSLKKTKAEIQNIEASTGYTSRKKDLTDPLNSMMGLLQSYIEASTGTAKERDKLAHDLQQNLLDLLKSAGEGYARNQGYYSHDPTYKTKDAFEKHKKKYPLPGVKDKDRKPFNFDRGY